MEKEKSFIESSDKKMCTGCGTCSLSCPKKCITMVEDEEGFKYPIVDKSKCINCKKCINICPVINGFKNNNIRSNDAYFYKSKNKNKIFEASSGGAFEDICSSFLSSKDKIAIFGATIVDNKVFHKYVTNIKDIYVFKKSKYVQSDLKETYKETKELLNNGYYVVYSGTPCQIAGLKKYLNNDYDNLLCIDLICHGVPSQKLLNLYVESEEKKYEKKIDSLFFREKIKLSNGKYDSKNIKIVFNDGTSIIKNSKNSSYLRGYSGRLFYRPSCYKCKFASIKRISDITIGDAWGIENICSDEDMHKGISTIIINTTKGMNTVKEMDGVFVKKIDTKFVSKNNSAFSKPSELNNNRNRFFKNLSADNFEEKVNKYYKLSISYRIKRKINSLINK